MKKFKFNKFSILIAGILASSSTLAVDFHGYGRAGSSTTTKGGEQMCYGSGADGHYVGRLGDECDSYVELGLGQDFTGRDGVDFRVNTMFSGQTSPGAQYNDYQSITEPGATSSRGDWALRQLNVEAKGLFPFAPESTLWAGKRYYQRKDVHLLDLYYLNDSGYGAGLEHIKAGIGNASIAWLTGDQTPYSGKTNASGEDAVQTEKFDVRYGDIPLWDNAALDLAAIYGRTDLTNVQKAADEPSDNGILLTSDLKHEFSGVTNHIVLQYGQDAMADGAWRNASGSKVTTYSTWEGDLDHSIRVIDYGESKITDRIDMGYSFLYAKAKTLSSSSDISESSPYRYSIVLRPSYYWNQHMRTTAEVGHESYKESYSVEQQNLNKVVIAQEFTPDIGLMSRPTIRFYAGRFFGNVADEATTGSSSGEAGNYRLGAQIEAWW